MLPSKVIDIKPIENALLTGKWKTKDPHCTHFLQFWCTKKINFYKMGELPKCYSVHVQIDFELYLL